MDLILFITTKKNGGMHTAHNRAYELIDTELNVCIDSDDFMADDAVESILKCWNEKGSDKLAGIIGLDADFGGEIIGKRIPRRNGKDDSKRILFQRRSRR